MSEMKILNLYSGLGGNRKFWPKCNVTAVEENKQIANVYKRLFPFDEMIVGDAHEYLLHNYESFDFIWSSPPCQTHSKLSRATRHKLNRYVDMGLYQEILFLQTHFKGLWVVENVKPFYKPLMEGKILGRHIYWSNFDVGNYSEKSPKNFSKLSTVSGKNLLMDWLGIHYNENIYYGSNHCPAQILRNCVHPNEGFYIYANMIQNMNANKTKPK